MSSRWIIIIGICSCLLIWMGCSSENPDAPGTNHVHDENYLLSHAGEANADIERCQTCHGNQLTGGNEVPGCFSCHSEGLTFAIHPLPYSDPEDHGAAGRNDLAKCFGCHGSPPNVFDGGILADPDLFNRPAADCSVPACHPDAGAHPTRWQGDNDITPDYLSTHRMISQATIQEGCALCHQVSDGGSHLLPEAPSCFSAGFTNSDNVTSSCHPAGFIPAHGLPYTDPEDHGGPAKSNLSACQQCHGTPGTIFFDGGSASAACSSTACHPDAGAHPTIWRSGHRSARSMTTSCTICHDVIRGRTAPNADAPSCFAGNFTNADGITSGCHSDGPGD